MMGSIFSQDDMRKVSNRIASIVSLEEIGRSVRVVTSDLRATREAIASARYM
jgi:hypothetical protein